MLVFFFETAFWTALLVRPLKGSAKRPADWAIFYFLFSFSRRPQSSFNKPPDEKNKLSKVRCCCFFFCYRVLLSILLLGIDFFLYPNERASLVFLFDWFINTFTEFYLVLPSATFSSALLYGVDSISDFLPGFVCFFCCCQKLFTRPFWQSFFTELID